MCNSFVVFLLAISCVTSFPVLFLTYKDGKGSQSSTRLLDCVSPIPFLDAAANSISYRCRPSSKTPESMGLKAKDLPLLEILEEPMNDITVVEISEEIVVPVASARTSFQASDVVVNTKEHQTAQEKDKYEVVPEPRTALKNSEDCPDGEMYLSELDMCTPFTDPIVEIEHKVAAFNAPESPVAHIDPAHKIIKVGYASIRCKEGEMYSPSIDICVPIGDKPEVSAVNAPKSPVAVINPGQTGIKVGYEPIICKEGEIHSPSIGICVPIETKREVAPINAPKPLVAIINPEHTIIKVGHDPIQCKEGEIHSPSIGICVPFDNCWPHPDCSHHDKEKDKKKNKNKANDEDD